MPNEIGLFDRVFTGNDQMYALAEKALADTVARLGADAPMVMPDTAYYCANILTYTGIQVKTLADLQTAMETIHGMMSREYRTKSAFHSGIATAMAAEVIEACKYADNPTPYDPKYHGHMTDAEVRELGVPLVTRDIPGFVVVIGPAPSQEEAVDLIRGYQSRGIFVFLIGGIIDQAYAAGLNMGFKVRVVPVGPDIWSVAHVTSLVVRAGMIFGAIGPDSYDEMNSYTIDRIFAFVNAYAPVDDLTVACGAGAITMGFPVITNDTVNMWPVPKTLLIQENTKDWIETSLEARDIKIIVTEMDIPVAYSSAFEGEIIRRGDMQLEIDGSRVDSFELVRTREAHEIEDGKIILDGPDIDSFEFGTRIGMAVIAEVAGKNMQSDFEPVFERKFHAFLNCMEGIMHTGQRDMIRIRVHKDAFNLGFRLGHIGEVLCKKIKAEYSSVVDKVQVTIVTDQSKLHELRQEASAIYAARDDRLANLTDESADVFYSCILCQSFSPAHVCVVSPERLGLCGAVSWLDAKATNELDPSGPCQIVTKEKVIDAEKGAWEDVNEAVNQLSHGALERVTLYSIMEDPMTSCGCFECICGIEPFSNGVVIVNREHAGMTPLGMKFSEMASMTGGGVQTPGFMGHGKHYIASKKFMKADGGLGRIVWMPKALKEEIAEKLNKSAFDLYGIENFTDMIGDETVATEIEPLMEFLTEKGHPALSMDPMM